MFALKPSQTPHLCTKKSAFPIHALHRSPATGLDEYTKRKCAQLDASPLTCRSSNEMLQYSCGTTCSVDATLKNVWRDFRRGCGSPLLARFPDYHPAPRGDGRAGRSPLPASRDGGIIPKIAALRLSELRAAAELHPERLALLLVLGLELLEHKLAHARLGLSAEVRKVLVENITKPHCLAAP